MQAMWDSNTSAASSITNTFEFNYYNFCKCLAAPVTVTPIILYLFNFKISSSS